MKSTILALSVLAFGATAAMAEDFKNNTFGVTVTSGMVDFNIDAGEDGLTNLEVGLTGFDHNIGAAAANVRFALGTSLDAANDVYLRGEYNVTYQLAEKTSLYGSAAVEYATNTKLDDGNLFADPSVGVYHQVTDKVAVFGEVGYTWDISEDWARQGGYAEVGMPVVVAQNVVLTPSVVYTFDAPATEDAANLNLDLAIKF